MLLSFLTTQPLWLSGTLLIGVATLIAMAGPILVRRRVSLDRLRINNEVAGFKFATVGVLYAVLLAFGDHRLGEVQRGGKRRGPRGWCGGHAVSSGGRDRRRSRCCSPQQLDPLPPG